MRSTLSYFDDTALNGSGHISPVFPHILKYFFKKNNLSLVEETYNRKTFDVLIIYSWKSYFYYAFMWIFSNLLKFFSLNKRDIEGVIKIYVVQKT